MESNSANQFERGPRRGETDEKQVAPRVQEFHQHQHGVIVESVTSFDSDSAEHASIADVSGNKPDTINEDSKTEKDDGKEKATRKQFNSGDLAAIKSYLLVYPQDKEKARGDLRTYKSTNQRKLPADQHLRESGLFNIHSVTGNLVDKTGLEWLATDMYDESLWDLYKTNGCPNKTKLEKLVKGRYNMRYEYVNEWYRGVRPTMRSERAAEIETTARAGGGLVVPASQGMHQRGMNSTMPSHVLGQFGTQGFVPFGMNVNGMVPSAHGWGMQGFGPVRVNGQMPYAQSGATPIYQAEAFNTTGPITIDKGTHHHYTSADPDTKAQLAEILKTVKKTDETTQSTAKTVKSNAEDLGTIKRHTTPAKVSASAARGGFGGARGKGHYDDGYGNLGGNAESTPGKDKNGAAVFDDLNNKFEAVAATKAAKKRPPSKPSNDRRVAKKRANKEPSTSKTLKAEAGKPKVVSEDDYDENTGLVKVVLSDGSTFLAAKCKSKGIQGNACQHCVKKGGLCAQLHKKSHGRKLAFFKSSMESDNLQARNESVTEPEEEPEEASPTAEDGTDEEPQPNHGAEEEAVQPNLEADGAEEASPRREDFLFYT